MKFGNSISQRSSTQTAALSPAVSKSLPASSDGMAGGTVLSSGPACLSRDTLEDAYTTDKSDGTGVHAYLPKGKIRGVNLQYF